MLRYSSLQANEAIEPRGKRFRAPRESHVPVVMKKNAPIETCWNNGANPVKLSSTSVKKTSRNVRKPRNRPKSNSWRKSLSNSPKLLNRSRRLRRQRHLAGRMAARSVPRREPRRNRTVAPRYSRAARRQTAGCAGCGDCRLKNLRTERP